MFDAAGTGGDGTGPRPAPTAAAIDAIETEVAELAGVLNTATARLVAVLGDALASGAWAQAGVRSPAHWLAWKAGMSPRRARRLVALAERAEVLPVTAAAFAAGALSEDQVTEIAAHVPASHDAELAELAHFTTVPQLQKVVRRYAFAPASAPSPERDPQAAPARPPDSPGEHESVRFGWTESGRWQLRADLDPARGALVQRALEASRDALFRDRQPGDGDDGPGAGATWADTLVRMADAALAGHLGDRRPSDRHQVIVHVRAGDAEGATWLHLGPALPSRVRRELGCDAAVRYLLEDDGGVPLKLGRRQHTVPPHLRTVLEDRDRQCRAPGCTQGRWLAAHHLTHWEDGGRTDPDNLVLLCPAHHRLHHHGGLGISGDPTRPDGLAFTDGHGRVLAPGAEPVPPGERPPPQLRPPRWRHPPGERLDTWWITFRDPPEAA